MIPTSGVKYLGSKASFVGDILNCSTQLGFTPQDTLSLDVFTGTTRVAQAFRQQGYKTVTSDLLPASTCYAHTWITNSSCNTTLLAEIIESLNNLTPKSGWLTQFYGEALPVEDKGAGKMVNAFTKANAMKADAIRDTIELLKPELQQWEYYTLITSLILAMNQVQNSQGHSRAFFRDFMPGALKPLIITLPHTIGNPTINYCDDMQFIHNHPPGHHYQGSALDTNYIDLVKNINKDNKVVAYIDPPYTTNLPYNQFYHLWDSVVLWDKPDVVGSTNRRSDRQSKREGGAVLSSSFTNKNNAHNSFELLYKNLATVADGLIISYSSDSIVSYDDMVDLIQNNGYKLNDVVDRQYVRHALGKSATASAETRKTAEKYNTEWIFSAIKT